MAFYSKSLAVSHDPEHATHQNDRSYKTKFRTAPFLQAYKQIDAAQRNMQKQHRQAL